MFYKKAKKFLSLSLLLSLLSVPVGNIRVFAENDTPSLSDATDSESEAPATERKSSKKECSKESLKIQPIIMEVYGNLYQELKWDGRKRTIEFLKNDTRPLREIYNADIIKTHVEKKGNDIEIANRFICELSLFKISSTLLIANVGGKDYVTVVFTLPYDVSGRFFIVDLSSDIKTRDTNGEILDAKLYYTPLEYIQKMNKDVGRLRSLYIVSEDVSQSEETLRSCKKLFIHPDTGNVEGSSTLHMPIRVAGEYILPASGADRKSEYFSLMVGYNETSKTTNYSYIPIAWMDFIEKYVAPLGIDEKLENLTPENLEEYRRDSIGKVAKLLRSDNRRLDMTDAIKFMEIYYR